MNFIVPQWEPDAQAMPNDNFVHLAQLARNTELSLTLLLLNEAPGLRYQLNFNGLVGMPWWSVFDAIQDIPLREGLPFDPADIPIPENSDLIYDFAQVLIVQDDRLLGRIYQHPNVGVWDVWWQTDNGGHRVDQYDDRGFVSTRTWLDADKQVIKKEWLDVTGEWVLRQTDRVIVAPQALDRFKHSDYPDIRSVVGEYLANYLGESKDENTLIGLANDESVAMSPFIPQNVTSHYFVTNTQDTAIDKLAPHTDSFITQTTILTRKVKARLKDVSGSNRVQVRTIPPFSTHLQLGHSNEVAEVITYWHVNGLDKAVADTIFNHFLEQFERDDDIRLIVDADNDEQTDHFQQAALIFAAKKAGIDLDSHMFARIQSAVSGSELPPEEPDATSPEVTTAVEMAAVAGDAKETVAAEEKELIGRVQAFLARIEYQVQADYEQVTQSFATARQLVDIGSNPDLFMQIAAISAGIPQINLVETGYVKNGENGIIIEQLADFAKAADYYLNSLAPWNEALVANAHLIDQYSEQHTQSLWQEVLVDGR
ncbi:accessory Sec system glycosyltransferase Asp1 [Schleiferilactobacillus perolens]|jgi:accessory Sec system protein Asp1|uniref:accessory Sec system glycosyltransferase Asp1 n=1 Tax=Schleiferilactobacillus perolens TaxID=100468 RepID=UPI00235735DB|nr:accessory Sec system glycosyltransferase Asp1 [Schleiferilactobacillus perolens]MCI2172285.1 accessory Sec system glycosyltransferase Asp1 [Schleiferilactobacillus perolens]